MDSNRLNKLEVGGDMGVFRIKLLYVTLVMLILVANAIPVQAEQCRQISGCKGMIGWFRVNKYAFNTIPDNKHNLSYEALFGTKDLPLVNSVIKIKRKARLSHIQWEINDQVAIYDREFTKGEIEDWSSGALKNIKEPDIESYIAAQDIFGVGTKVRILGYHQGWHLFVLVQIISYPFDIYKSEPKNYAYFDEEI